MWVQRFYFPGLLAILSVGIVADELPFTRDVDLIYHKEGGYALTMDRVAPVAGANGAAVVALKTTSGARSARSMVPPRRAAQYHWPRVRTSIRLRTCWSIPST